MSTLQQIVEQQLRWRYATKRFDSARRISDADWSVLEQSLLLAPSSCGLQPWRVISVTSTELRTKLREFSWDQPQIVEASHLVVLAAKNSFDDADLDAAIELISTTRGVPAQSLDGYRQMIASFLSGLRKHDALEAWCTHQAYIGLGFLMASAATLGIDTCPLEGIIGGRYDELLGLESLGLRTKVACALGYRSPADQLASLKKVRLPREHFILSR
jgi:nitroreductase